MLTLNQDSLSMTLDSLNEARFFGESIATREAKRTLKWIAERQGLPRSYAGMFAPSEVDFSKGIRLFTGEPVRSKAATGHILGEEACRAVILLDRETGASTPALARATQGMSVRLVEWEAKGKPAGTFCCGTCTSALWRHLAVGGLKDQERRLSQGIIHLKKHRDGAGKWRRFPYFYTLLALSELDIPSAVSEMRYAAHGCERLLKGKVGKGETDRRRRALAERVLEKV